MRSICILNDTTLKTGVVPFCHSGIFLRLNGFDLSMQIMNKNSAYPLQVNFAKQITGTEVILTTNERLAISRRMLKNLKLALIREWNI